MKTAVVTMGKENMFQAFKIFEDGSAVMETEERVIKVADFASLFIDMCERGWQRLTETEIITTPKAKEKQQQIGRHGDSRKGILRQLDGFRSEWVDYMEANSENFELC